MPKSNDQVIVNNDMSSLRAGRDVYRKDYINGRVFLPLKNLQRINADAACSTYEMSVGTLVDILTCHSHYTTKQIAELVEDTRKLENSKFKLRLSENGFVYVSRETYPRKTTTVSSNMFAKYAKEVQELFEYFTNYDIDDSVRKTATNAEFNLLRDKLLFDHDIFTAYRGKKFAPIVAGTTFKLSEHTNEQLLELVNNYSMMEREDMFLDTLIRKRKSGHFGMAFVKSGYSQYNIHFIESYNVFVVGHHIISDYCTFQLKHYNDVCKED